MFKWRVYLFKLMSVENLKLRVLRKLREHEQSPGGLWSQCSRSTPSWQHSPAGQRVSLPITARKLCSQPLSSREAYGGGGTGEILAWPWQPHAWNSAVMLLLQAALRTVAVSSATWGLGRDCGSNHGNDAGRAGLWMPIVHTISLWEIPVSSISQGLGISRSQAVLDPGIIVMQALNTGVSHLHSRE